MTKVILSAFIAVAFSFSHNIFTCERANKPERFIFIGNPGVGKSTLINSLIGQEVAGAGISAGVGLTKFFSEYLHDGKWYMDTPGLADTKLREQAAREIEKALKQNGDYRIFFVIGLRQGRVLPEDVTTINAVMEAIKNSGSKFNIIINQLGKKEKREILKDHVEMAKVYAQINSGKHKTDSIYFIDKQQDIEDGDTNLIKIDDLLRQFIYEKSQAIRISSFDVGKIETHNYEAIKKQFEQDMLKLQQQIKQGNENYSNLFQQMKGVQKALEESREASEIARRDAERFSEETKSLQRYIHATELENEKNKTQKAEEALKVAEKEKAEAVAERKKAQETSGTTINNYDMTSVQVTSHVDGNSCCLF